MRIAQVAPLFESVPPRLYGGTERVVHYLTEELVARGHEVTLFASGDSRTSARLIAGCETSLRLAGKSYEEAEHHRSLLRESLARQREFDLVHFHIDDWPQRVPSEPRVPHVTTVHGRIDTADRLATYAARPSVPLVSISNAQRTPLPALNWVGTVYHGLPFGLYAPRPQAGDYLLFVGRMCREKRVDRAIEIAGRFGMRLKIAAKIDHDGYAYYRSIQPLLREPCVEFLGEVSEADKGELFGGAYALLFPVDWPEPFGLAVVEAMSCGVPVVAWRVGSIPEIVDEGVSGFSVDSVEGALAALRRLPELDRAQVARVARQRFSAQRMADDYLDIYERVRSRIAIRRQGTTGSDDHARPRE